MTVHTLYPGFVKFSYTGNAHAHVQVLPCHPTTILGASAVLLTDGVSTSLFTDAVDAYLALFKATLKTTDGIGRAELWGIASPGADPVFIEAYDTSLAGTSTGTISPYNQAVLTFRTSGGGLLRWYDMEQALAPTDYIDRAPLLAGAFKDIADYITGAGGWFFGRDGSGPVSAISLITKVNDKLRKKFLLNP